MTRTTASQLGRRLRRLDRPALVRFVAALWAASGWSTAVRDGRVVARRTEPSRERLDLAVVTGASEVGRALLAGVSDADVLVAPIGERTARLLAARTGIEVVDAADLEERLTYAVGAEAREHLLSTYVPDPPGTPSRRAVLIALTAGTGGVAAVAVAADEGEGPEMLAELRDAPGGQPPDVADDDSDAGGSIDHPQWTHATGSTSSPPSRTAEGTAAPGGECDVGPAETVAEQLASLMELFAPGAGSDVDGDGEIEYDRPMTTDAFREAVEAVGVGPIRYAVATSVGRPLDVGPVTRVPASVRTRSGRLVLYEFSLQRTPEDCWRTRSAEIVATWGATN